MFSTAGVKNSSVLEGPSLFVYAGQHAYMINLKTQQCPHVCAAAFF